VRERWRSGAKRASEVQTRAAGERLNSIALSEVLIARSIRFRAGALSCDLGGNVADPSMPIIQ
jgi:hypothetical protein